MSKRARMRSRAFPVRLREAALEKVDLREAPQADAAPSSASGRMLVQLITAGWGSSGYYGEDVLREAAATRRFASGLAMYLDHPTLSDEVERPERSVRDLAAVLTEDARYDDSRKALVAEAKALPTYRHLLGDKDFVEAVGLSIRAGGLAEYGQVGDRKGLIVKEITEATSVDYVTKAGRGGKVLALLESARQATAPAEEPAEEVPLREARNIGAWLESRLHLDLTTLADDMYGDGRLTRDERITLSSAIGKGLQAYTAEIESSAPQLFRRDLYDRPEDVRVTESARLRESTSDQIRTALTIAVRDAYSADNTWCWVRDYDADRGVVWFDVEASGDGCTTYQQAYTTSGADATVTAALDGERVAVIAQTVYVPAAADTANTDLPLYENAEMAEPTTDVTDGAPPTGSTTPTNTEEGPDMSGTSTGAVAPTPAGTAPVVDTAAIQFEAREAAPARDRAVGERYTALAEAAESKTRADKAEAELATFRAVEAARPVAVAVLAESGLPQAAQARIVAAITSRVPLTEAGVLDEAALKTLVEAEAAAEKTYLASLAEADGAGRVTGLGQAASPLAGTFTPPAVPQPNAALREAYIARGMPAAAADLAATGRPF